MRNMMIAVRAGRADLSDLHLVLDFQGHTPPTEVLFTRQWMANMGVTNADLGKVARGNGPVMVTSRETQFMLSRKWGVWDPTPSPQEAAVEREHQERKQWRAALDRRKAAKK